MDAPHAEESKFVSSFPGVFVRLLWISNVYCHVVVRDFVVTKSGERDVILDVGEEGMIELLWAPHGD
jgi:hypothetical protein